MTPHKRKAGGEGAVASEAHHRANSTVVHAPSSVPLPAAAALPPFLSRTMEHMQSNEEHAEGMHIPSASSAVSASVATSLQPTAASAAASLSSSRSAAEDGQSTAEHVAANMHGASSPLTTASSSRAAAAAGVPIQPTAAAAVAASSDSTATAANGQIPPMTVASFDRLADVEAQLIMQHLDRRSLLRLARCSRSLFRCASHPFAWQQLSFSVEVNGSEIEYDHRRNHSLLRFASSDAAVDQHASDPRSLVDCATLIRVPQLISLMFHAEQPIMQLDEWHRFLQHPSAQRLTDVHIVEQPALCGTDSLSLLSRLPLLHSLRLRLPAAASTSYFEPLANSPSLTELALWGPDGALHPPPFLEPLARCTGLQVLELHDVLLRIGELSAMLILLARLGGQLKELELEDMQTLSMNDASNVVLFEPSNGLGLELVFAAPHLQHLYWLRLDCDEVGSLEFVPCLPSLRDLDLLVRRLPSTAEVLLLLVRLPALSCTVALRCSVGQSKWHQENEARLPQLRALAQQCTRLTVSVPPAH